VGVAITLAYYFLGGLGLKNTIITVMLGVVSNLAYEYLKGKTFTK
jgi:hypothetical protein